MLSAASLFNECNTTRFRRRQSQFAVERRNIVFEDFQCDDQAGLDLIIGYQFLVEGLEIWLEIVEIVDAALVEDVGSRQQVGKAGGAVGVTVGDDQLDVAEKLFDGRVAKLPQLLRDLRQIHRPRNDAGIVGSIAARHWFHEGRRGWLSFQMSHHTFQQFAQLHFGRSSSPLPFWWIATAFTVIGTGAAVETTSSCGGRGSVLLRWWWQLDAFCG